MSKANILVVEDDPRVVIFLVDLLKYNRYGVRVARNGREGLNSIAEKKPDLIVLDVMMPEMDGYEVCQHLKSSSDTKQIPILMLTAKGKVQDRVKGFGLGADYYLSKPYDNDELIATVEAALRKARSLPFTTEEEHCDVIISLEAHHRIRMRITGKITTNAVSEQLLSLNVDEYSRLASNTDGAQWRFNSKHTGRQLFANMFKSHPEILANYHRTLGEVGKFRIMHLQFEGGRDLLALPVEFLYDDSEGNGDYLVLKHPISRMVRGIQTKKQPLCAGFWNKLCEKDEALRILLVASNTGGIPSVDREVQALEEKLGGFFDAKNIRVNINSIPSNFATYDHVRQELKDCRYHILHYAGHGSHIPDSPEKSQIFFWSDSSRSKIKPMSASELMMLVRESDLRLAYLSCCFGAETGKTDKLLDDDFLGVSDALIQANVPAVLGFRWPVSDDGAKAFALSFYRSLAQHGELDLASLDARCDLAGSNRDDRTWLAPILILQK
jgi:DNA-binding response OmpR family regulator